MSRSTTERKRKTPYKYKDNALKETKAKENSKYNIGFQLLTLYYVQIGWCTILCLEDNKEYLSPAIKLESKDGLELTASDIRQGKTVIWQYRGAPYEAEILKVHGK